MYNVYLGIRNLHCVSKDNLPDNDEIYLDIIFGIQFHKCYIFVQGAIFQPKLRLLGVGREILNPLVHK